MNKELVKLIFVLFISIANLSAVYILLNDDGMLKQKRTMDSVIADSTDMLGEVKDKVTNIAVEGKNKLKSIVVPEKKKETIHKADVVLEKKQKTEKVK